MIRSLRLDRGLAVSKLRQIERSRTSPSISSLRRIAAALAGSSARSDELRHADMVTAAMTETIV
jgi:transcriptional regulator with XRE-family HTH domain